ncbi:GNAT family N-acetyltransferase [Nocardioides carbamazepini]|uniref:GNAT family N-acetyltransferase n=1 Tax=Nocardioides carbamazepini TaxID=2854259 RepID=UPI002149A78F|nr:GNAT family N-acetyltransferase [Nocardioides carbamazepini]MCR1781563.1 GNAT family N-acetyltransferase [Nocardioides carbamazepini]
MSRYSLTTRVATRDDAVVLAELWNDAVRRADPAEQVVDLELIIKGAAASPEQRLVVVEYDGQVAGAVYLRITTLSPLNLEPCVQSMHPRVFDHCRRHGVGHALVEAATAFAEENGILHVVTAVPHSSRESNRFMARLGLAPVVMYRIAPTALLRSRVSPQRQQTGVDGSRNRVLAARRSLRRARTERLALPEPEQA